MRYTPALSILVSNASKLDRIADDTGTTFFKVTSSIGWRRYPRADRLAVFVEARGEVALNAVIDDPVIATVGVNPDARFKLAQVLLIKAPVN